MNIVLGVIVGFLILMALVVAHEFGHFIAARKNGVEVEEFGIGFPPRAIAWIRNPEYLEWKAKKKAARKDSKKLKELGKKPKAWLRFPKSEWGKPQKTLVFSLNWLPIGGFCSMKGESDSDRHPHSFGAASFWGKTKILFAGVAMNWLVAFIILTVLSWTGMPEFMEGQFTMPGDTVTTPAIVTVNEVMGNSPAADSNFHSGDIIVSAYPITDSDSPEITVFNTASDIINFDKQHAEQSVIYTVLREGEEYNLPTKLNSADAKYLLGVTMKQAGQPSYRSTWSAPIIAAVNTIQLTGETYRGLGNMIGTFFSGLSKQFSADESTRLDGQSQIKAAGDSVSGPVGIIGILFPNSVAAGPTTLAFLAAIISISLACMNVLPIPALDGGRFTLIALFRIRGKKLTKEIEEKIVARAFIFLLILIALVTALDITRFFI